MSIGTWEPQPSSNKANQAVDSELLATFVTLGSGELKQLQGTLTDEQLKRGQQLMQLPKDTWKDIWSDAALAAFSTAQLWALIRFFTVAEEQLTGWEAGEKSPVIAINKYLKSQGYKLSAEELQWIRQHSRNRYLPNGPIL